MYIYSPFPAGISVRSFLIHTSGVHQPFFFNICALEAVHTPSARQQSDNDQQKGVSVNLPFVATAPRPDKCSSEASSHRDRKHERAATCSLVHAYPFGCTMCHVYMAAAYYAYIIYIHLHDPRSLSLSLCLSHCQSRYPSLSLGISLALSSFFSLFLSPSRYVCERI